MKNVRKLIRESIFKMINEVSISSVIDNATIEYPVEIVDGKVKIGNSEYEVFAKLYGISASVNVKDVKSMTGGDIIIRASASGIEKEEKLKPEAKKQIVSGVMSGAKEFEVKGEDANFLFKKV